MRRRRAPDLIQLQQKREEAEKAREEALRAQADANKQKQELESKLAEIDRQAREAALHALTPDGSMFVHLDYREVHYVKVALDALLDACREFDARHQTDLTSTVWSQIASQMWE